MKLKCSKVIFIYAYNAHAWNLKFCVFYLVLCLSFDNKCLTEFLVVSYILLNPISICCSLSYSRVYHIIYPSFVHVSSCSFYVSLWNPCGIKAVALPLERLYHSPSTRVKWHTSNTHTLIPIRLSCSWAHGNDINSLRPRQNAPPPLFFPDDIFKCIFFRLRMYEFRLRFHWILFLRFELKIF